MATRLDEKLTIDQSTNEVKGVTTGKVYAKGENLQEALALQTQIASGDTPSVAGRPDLYAIEPTAEEKSATYGKAFEPTTDSTGVKYTPTVATTTQLAQRAAGTLPSLEATRRAVSGAEEVKKTATTLADAMREATTAGASKGYESALGADDSYDTQLDKQKLALMTAYLDNAVTPEELRWLNPAQQAAIRSGKKDAIETQLSALNSIRTQRSEKAKEAKAEAWTKLETLRQYGLLSTLDSTALEELSSLTGIPVSSITSLQPDTAGVKTETVPLYNSEGKIVAQQLINSETGEVIATYSGGATSSDIAISSAYENGYYGGECGEFVHELIDIPPVGNTFESKMSLTSSSITADSAQVGDYFVQDKGAYGHVGVINAISTDEDGNKVFTVTESNWNGDHKVTNTRQVTADEISGFGRYSSKITDTETVKLAKDYFSETQIAKGASEANLSISDFGKLSIDEANKYINISSEDEEIKTNKETILSLLSEGGTVASIKKMLDEAIELNDMSDIAKTELYSFLKEKGTERDKGKWHFGLFEGPDVEL